MHSYQHHIKDFNNATRHLTRVERSLYRDAIELYYETEQPLPADDFERLARRLMAVTEEEKAALRVVLDEFFDLTGNVYSHDRCDEEIEKFHNTQTAKSAAGKASAEARRQRQEARKEARKKQNSTGVEQPLNSVETESQQKATNQKPETINQEPSTPLERGSKILTGVSASEKIEKPDATASPPPAHSAPENSKNVIRKRIQQPFRPTEAAVRLAEKHGLDVGIEADLFVAHYESTGEFRDSWDACFRKWLLRSMQYKADAEQRAQSPPGRASNGFKKFDAADYNRGNDGYGKPRKNNIIDVNGIVVDEVPALQGKISD